MKQIHSIPLDLKSLEAAFSEKVKIVCNYYSKLLKVRPGEGSERWLLRQGMDLKGRYSSRRISL